MADGGSGGVTPETFWGTIQLAARLHATTAELWQAIRDDATNRGVALPSGMFRAVSQLRARATELRNASERIGRAQLTDAITGDMIGQQLYARPAMQQSLSPSYHVRFELEIDRGDGPRPEWFVYSYTGGLPATVGDLMADLTDYSAGLGGSYGVEVGEIYTVEIGAW